MDNKPNVCFIIIMIWNGGQNLSLGLKDCELPYLKRCIIKNAKHTFYEIKYAFQRFWRGYDDTYYFSLDAKLNELIPTILKWYRINRHGSPCFSGNEGDCHEEWNSKLDEILHYFNEGDDETCSEKNEFDELMDFSFEFVDSGKGYSTLVENNDKELNDKWFEREMEIEEYTKSNRQKAYGMIAEYIDCFWD